MTTALNYSLRTAATGLRASRSLVSMLPWFVLSGVATCVLTAVMHLLGGTPDYSFIDRWMESWLTTWPFAFPAAYLLAQVLCRKNGRNGVPV